MKAIPKSEKTFDCVAFKRRAQERIYRRIAGLPPADEIAYFRNAAETGPLGAFWRTVAQRNEQG